jgi:hypothetical protein
MGAFVWFFIPETKGVSLEKMDELFGVTTHTTKDVEDRPGSEPVASEVKEETAEKTEKA